MQCISAESEIRNLLVTISYDGHELHGWQIQENALSVQEVFQTALTKIIGDNIDVKGCSRTDSGVHANMYCITVITNHQITCERLKLALNRYLPKNIVCLDCKEMNRDFHARYSCTGKEYIYRVWNGKVRNPFLENYAYQFRYPIDEKELDLIAKDYVGKHDFTSFCTKDSRVLNDLSRTVEYFNVKRVGDEVIFIVKADGFLYNMVRIMVGTLLKISQNKLDKHSISDILNKKDRKFAGPTAPACGLYLNKVFYGEVNE